MSDVVITILRNLDIDDLRKKTHDGGPSLALRIRNWWFERGRRMYRTHGRYTGTPWPKYQTTKGKELRYVAIKANIYKRAGASFSKNRDLLKWMGASGGPLYRSLTDRKSSGAIYRGNRKSIRVGTRRGHAADLSTGGAIPRWLGGGRYPARPMLAFRGRAKVDLNRIKREWARDQERGLDMKFSRNPVIVLDV